MLVIIPALQWALDYQLVPTKYESIIVGVVLPILAWIGRKISQPSLHNANQFVTVTAGHSNIDPGAVNGKFKEAELVTKFRNAVAHYLKEAGIAIKTDGVGSDNHNLNTAIKLIKDSDIAVEFHMNAAANKAAYGIETIALSKDKKLAQDLSKVVAKAFNSKLRGDDGWIDQSQSARGKLGFVNNGGLIVELGFILNEAELKTFNEKYWLAARDIADVLIRHVK
ncbi:N-acetylmuramoyl-L-alanine amidase [Acinetobacter defluvii]|uniref:N-acetylmuramoyl-L-alanine amidase n=1 Tax=Acinetobacter defluvii TaxID=1871111 RepID=UPI00148F8D74|nr:N-acetylmuramoyl-L-alanine amidase [Acinetobacter defluvii]